MAVINFKLEPSDLERFAKDVHKAVKREFNRKLATFLKNIKKNVAQVVNEAIIQSEEYQSMNFGNQLYHELGEINIKGAVEGIIKWIQDKIEVVPIPGKDDSETWAGLKITIRTPTKADILDIPYSAFISEKGFEVPWLDWLLFKGVGKVVKTHYYTEEYGAYGRTGSGFMKKSVKGEGWGVPAEYAGTQQNNWLTRAFRVLEPQIQEALDRSFAEF
jgi:hypothetical protein